MELLIILMVLPITINFAIFLYKIALLLDYKNINIIEVIIKKIEGRKL